MQRRTFVLSSTATVLLAACGGSDAPSRDLRVGQRNLSASSDDLDTFKPTLRGIERESEFLNAWGIAIRPAGAGGHFWVTAGGWSYQFVGDVLASADPSLRTLFQDALTLVQLPGAGAAPNANPTDPESFIGFGTGVVFNGAPLDSTRFVVRDQRVVVDGREQVLAGSARFIFATDSGVISGWTERNATNGSIVRRNGSAVAVIDRSAEGQAYFGLAIKPGSWDRLWAADFGAQPQIRAFDAAWQPVALGGAFANPFIGGRPEARPGDLVPFNIQVLDWRGQPHAFVAYARSRRDPADPARFLAGEEDALDAAAEGSRPDRGGVAIFDLDGRLVRVVADDGRLNAPWGLAVAPAGFGSLGGALLVGNFGGRGRIAAYDLETNQFIGYLRAPDGTVLGIEGLWGLQFGNGASLGDSDTLYFAAGPAEETQGLFGALRRLG
jgi:uncharacterized protein (TIGR03118 family)